MVQRAATFHFSPTPIMGSGSGSAGEYLEFPKDADPILRVIYQQRGVEGGSPPEMLEQGAPSTISSSAASNSDSGIGGRDTDALLPQALPPRQPPNHGPVNPGQAGAVGNHHGEEERRGGNYHGEEERRVGGPSAPSPSPGSSSNRPGAAKLTVRAMPD